MQRLGTKWFCISDFGWRRWSGAPPLDRLPAKAEGARSIHRWLRMHRPLTSFSRPAEAVYQGVASVIPNSFLGARSESWALGEDQCSRPSKGMLLSGLQRYYLSPDTPCTPSVWMALTFIQGHSGIGNKKNNFGVHFLANLSIDLHEIQFVPVGLLKLLLKLFWTSTIQGRELC